MKKGFISKEDAISVYQFMSICGLECDRKWDNKKKVRVSHEIMLKKLCLRNKKFGDSVLLVKRLPFHEVITEDIKIGKIIAVYDDYGKLYYYENPRCFNNNLLMKDLNCSSSKKELDKLKEKRREILKSMGYTYDDFGQVIEDDCVNIKEYQEEKEDQLEKVSGETEIIYIPDVHINRTKQMIKRGTRGSVFK
ncbi:MAG: hypothetical protein PHN42_00675 [Bacilli bacterium]|nr:hypothetical protein [Bacilli bacterium]